MLRGLATQLGHAPTAAERAEVLQRLVDEELLLQRGLALDLARRDSRLRGLLLQEVMRQALAGPSAQPVGEAELRGFFATNAGYFARPELLRVQRRVFADDAAARTFAQALAARGAPALAEQAARRDPLVPDGLLPLARLGDYVGSEAAARMAGLAPGASLQAALADGRVGVLVLVEREAARTPAFEEVRAAVEQEFRRRRDEQALADYLRQLRAEARIEIEGAR